MIILPRNKFLLVFFFSLLVFLSAHSKPVSFSDAWQIVLQEHDGLAAGRANIEHAEHIKDAAHDLYLPNISIGASYTRLDKPIELSPADILESLPIEDLSQLIDVDLASLNSSLTSRLTNRTILTSSVRAIWPIFTGGSINAVQDIAAGKLLEAEHLLAMQQQAKFEDLTKIYFAVVLSKQVLSAKIEVENGLLQHLDNARKLEKQGQIAKVERLQAEVAFDKSRVERKKSQRSLEIVQVALTQLLKSKSISEPNTLLFTNESLPPMGQYIDNTLARYPGLKILDAKKKQAMGLIAVEKGKHSPKVFLYGGYNLYEEDTLTAKLTPDWEVGVGVTIPLVSSSGHSNKKKAAYSSVEQVGYLRAQALQDLSLLVEKIYRQANQSLEEYNGLLSSLALAQENLLLRNEAFTQGLSKSLDVVDAQLFLVGIKTQRLAAAYRYVISLSKLLAVSGEIASFKQYQQYKSIEVKQ